MKNIMTALAILIAITTSTLAGTLKISPAPNIIRHGGEEIPLTFTASGFAPGTIAQVWLVNARTWAQENLVYIDLPINNGVNTVQIPIGWSWYQTGPYVVRVVLGDKRWTSSTVVNIRSAVIWPYPGSSYYHNHSAVVTWSTDSYIAADTINVSLRNEYSGESILVAGGIDPQSGGCEFQTPDIAGGIFRVVLEGFLLIDQSQYDPGDQFFLPDLNEYAESGLIFLK